MNREELAALEKLQKKFERRELGSYSPYIKAVTDNASELIERARKAEELERENGELLREWRTLQNTLRGMDIENERLFRALEACRAEMEHEGMDTSTPVRELHRGGRLEDV